MMSKKKRSQVGSYVNHDLGTQLNDVPSEVVPAVFIAGIFFIVIPSKMQHNVVFGFISHI